MRHLHECLTIIVECLRLIAISKIDIRKISTISHLKLLFLQPQYRHSILHRPIDVIKFGPALYSFQVTSFFAFAMRVLDLIAIGTNFEISQGFHTQWRSHFWRGKAFIIEIPWQWL